MNVNVHTMDGDELFDKCVVDNQHQGQFRLILLANNTILSGSKSEFEKGKIRDNFQNEIIN